VEAAVLQYAANLVIVYDDAFRVPLGWLDLLDACPRLRFLAVASEGHRSAMCELLGDVPPQKLVTVVTSGSAKA
jgi:hypothetical protein